MKKVYLILILAVAIGAGCKKDPVAPAPKADFTINGKAETTTTLAQGSYTNMNNASEKSASYLWDFGDGNTSTDENVLFRFNKAGTYNVSLTIKTTSGQTSVVKKQVKVLPVKINSIAIAGLTGLLYALDSDVPKISKADVWVEIRKSEKGHIFTETPDETGNVTLVYKSPVFPNLTPTSTAVINTENMTLDIAALNDSRYLITLYAKDLSTGKTYRLFNNSYSGSDDTFNSSLERNALLWEPSFTGYKIEVRGTFQ